MPRLDAAETALFNELRDKRLHNIAPGAKAHADGVRLEQERIGFEWVKAALVALPPSSAESAMVTDKRESKKWL